MGADCELSSACVFTELRDQRRIRVLHRRLYQQRFHRRGLLCSALFGWRGDVDADNELSSGRVYGELCKWRRICVLYQRWWHGLLCSALFGWRGDVDADNELSYTG